jgi:hypothetical protein
MHHLRQEAACSKHNRDQEVGMICFRHALLHDVSLLLPWNHQLSMFDRQLLLLR